MGMRASMFLSLSVASYVVLSRSGGYTHAHTHTHTHTHGYIDISPQARKAWFQDLRGTCIHPCIHIVCNDMSYRHARHGSRTCGTADGSTVRRGLCLLSSPSSPLILMLALSWYLGYAHPYSTCLSVRLSCLCLSVSLSVCLSVCLSVNNIGSGF